MGIDLKAIVQDRGMKFFDKTKYEKPVEEIVEPEPIVIPEPTIAPPTSVTTEVVRWEYINWVMVVYSENSLITEEESVNESILDSTSTNDIPNAPRKTNKTTRRKQSSIKG